MKFAPINLLIAFIAGTFLLIVLGPIHYVGFNPLLTGGFLLLVCVAMYVGFTTGVRAFERTDAIANSPAASGSASGVGKTKFLPIFYFCLIVACAGLVFSIFQTALSGQLNFSPADLGQSYVDAYQSYERNTGQYSLTFIVYSMTAPASFIASIWGILYFRQLPIFARLTVGFLIGGTLLFYTVGSGKQEPLGDAIVYLLSVWAVLYGRAGKAFNWRVVLTAISAAFIAIVGFVAILGQRYAALAVDIFNINVRTNPLMSFDLDHPVFQWLGYDVGFAFAVLSGYFSQGYFGLSLSLESDATWSYMIGFSYSLMVIADRVFGLPFLADQTYPYIVGAQTGWDESKWHSIFPHWASDFTFPGTIVLFGFFAFAFAKAWNRCIRFDDPFAVLLFALMTQGALFIPANNQLFISPGSLATVAAVVVLYLCYSKRCFAPVGK